MQSQKQNTVSQRKEDDEDDRAGFFLFPFFRGKRIEAIPTLLIFAAFLYFGFYMWERPAPPAPPAPKETAAAPEPALPKEVTAAATPEPVAVETQRWGSSIIFPVAGKDGAGKNAAFDVAVLPKELSWTVRSSTQLSQNGEIIPDDQLVDRLFTPELKDGLAKSTQVIAIGLASQEGQLEEETERANSRAKTAAGWLANAVAPETPIWLLNLGQFKKSGCPAQTETTDTSWQRPVILVGVKSADEGADLVAAFGDAISGKSNLPSRECYTSFDLVRFR